MGKIKGWEKEFEDLHTIGYTNNDKTLVEVYKVGDGWNTQISSKIRTGRFLSRKKNKVEALKQARVWMRKHPNG